MSRLPVRANSYRFFSRLRSPISPGEIRRTERWLATARMFLAISALVAGLMDPSELGRSVWVFLLLSLYIVHGLLVMILLRVRKESTASFRWLVHGADIVWPVLVALFVTGHGSLLFLFFFFVLGAAAYRWGLQETVGTAIAMVTLLWVESFAVQHGLVASINGILERHNLPLMVAPVDLEPRVFMLSIYLVVMGILLGYLAEQQKQLRAERAVITRVLGRVRVEAGLSRTLQDILAELLALYGARQAIIASQESDHHRVFVGTVEASESGPSELRWLDSSPLDRETYLYDSPADTWLVFPKSSSLEVLALDSGAARLRLPASNGPGPLAKRHSFKSFAAVSFTFGTEWVGRIFLLDPVLGRGEREEELRFLQELVRQVGPAAYNVYLLRRLRQRAGALERARVARELHDGAVQSLIAVEMQVDVLKRQAGERSNPIASELDRIQKLLREEILQLRELMQQMKSLEVDSRNLLRFLTDAVERFQRETGISARFVSELDNVVMPQRVCRELVRIVQEGLVNVRKWSKAHRVLVRLTSEKERWQLIIEDDGQGFPFSGRFSQIELEAMGKGPLVIRERVRLIEGELTVESNPSRGARLEVTVPHHRESTNGQ